MVKVESIKELRKALQPLRSSGKTIGFVPTMGFLHEGHMSLMAEAKKYCDIVVVSLFVNPTQFGPNEDFDAYPRDIEGDAEKCIQMGVDYLFTPSAEEMYPTGAVTFINVESDITKRLCGASRPGHFKGVTTIVGKLFNIVQPNMAFFGQKDAQQVAVIERMVKDLNMPVTIVPCPIVRESDGLALSSRNTYLGMDERQSAPVIYQTLMSAREAIVAGERDADYVKQYIKRRIEDVPFAKTDYVEIVDALSLEPLTVLKGDVLIAVAVKFGKPRLIDNIRMVVES